MSFRVSEAVAPYDSDLFHIGIFVDSGPRICDHDSSDYVGKFIHRAAIEVAHCCQKAMINRIEASNIVSLPGHQSSIREQCYSDYDRIRPLQLITIDVYSIEGPVSKVVMIENVIR